MGDYMITVTAIIPVYNVKSFLPRCLDSVLRQTVPFERVVIINDGSTDGCREICETYADNYSNIRLINKENGGLVSAWMEGLKYVGTSHICFIDSDDFISEDYLETLVRGIDSDVDMVCMNATQAFDTGEQRLFRINGLAPGTYEINDEFKGRMLSDHGAFVRPVASCRWAKLIRADLVIKYSQYCTQEISYGEDQQLTLGVLLGCKRIRILDEYKYYYQYNTTSILHTYRKNLWEKIELLMKTIDGIPGMRDIPEYQKQYNTQFLLYFCECVRNESYNGSLTKKNYIKLVSSNNVQIALKDFFQDNLRRIDRIIINNAQNKEYIITVLFLELYKLIYRIRRIPG